MRSLPPMVVRLADASRGVFSRRDAIALGFAPSTVDDWITSGLCEHAARGELRVCGSGDLLIQRLAWQLWRAGSGAVLAGGLLCGLRGLDGFTIRDIDHIAIPPGRRVRGVDYPVVRTPIADEDRDRCHDLPAATIERGLVGAAGSYPPARVRKALHCAVRRGDTDDDRMRALVDRLGRAYGAPQMRRILDTGAARVESPREFDVLQMFQPGDPQPETQVWVCWHAQWFRLDFAFLPARLALEYDGGQHDFSRDEDADRDLALSELDIQTTRITRPMTLDPAALRRRILTVYRRRIAMSLPPIVPASPPWQ